MQPLSDIELIDDPYTMFLITEQTLNLAPALAYLPAETRQHLARLADGVVESILSFPFCLDGFRNVARARWRETTPRLDRDFASWRLGRSPALIASATLDGAAIDPAELIVQGATGTVRLASGCFPAGSVLAVDFDAGWLTPAQAVGGAPADFGPGLPQPIIAAAVRAAQLAASGLDRDPGLRSAREADGDAGELERTYAAPPLQGGEDADIFRLLAPWRRLALS